MATLNTLRTKGGWIVTIVIGVSLIAFLLGDLTGNGSIMGGDVSVGEINGEKISYQEYYNEVEHLSGVNEIMSGGSGAMDEQTRMAINNYAWNQLFNKYAMEPGYKKLGIEVTDDEMLERVYGERISPVLGSVGFFNDPQTGLYDKSLMRNFVTNLSYDTSGQLRVLWEYLQQQVEQEAVFAKYTGVVSKMVYVTDIEANLYSDRANKSYSADYVTLPYTSVPEEEAKPAAADIRGWYETHRNAYRQVAARDVEYVVFDVLPSEQDYLDAQSYINNLSEEFAAAENPMQFATLNSQSAVDSRYFTRLQLTPEISAFAFDGAEGELFGPTLASDIYTMARVSDRRSMPDSLGVRQFVLPLGAVADVDSLVNAINQEKSFALNAAFIAGGNVTDMGIVPTAFIPGEVIDQILATPRGNVVRVDNPNGTMIMEVYHYGANVPAVQLATVVYNVEPSPATQQAAYSKASGFVTAASGAYDKFTTAVTDNAYNKSVLRIYSTDDMVSGFENAKELSQWAFNAKDKEVSPIMELDGDYVVAALTGIIEDGHAPLDQVLASVTASVTREKRGDILAEKMKNASSVAALASQLGVEAGEISDFNFDSYYIAPIGSEPAVAGAATGLQQGAVSKPIRGTSGVYVMSLKSVNTDENTSPVTERARIEAVEGGEVAVERILEAVRTMSGIKDSRIKYF